MSIVTTSQFNRTTHCGGFCYMVWIIPYSSCSLMFYYTLKLVIFSYYILFQILQQAGDTVFVTFIAGCYRLYEAYRYVWRHSVFALRIACGVSLYQHSWTYKPSALRDTHFNRSLADMHNVWFGCYGKVGWFGWLAWLYSSATQKWNYIVLWATVIYLLIYYSFHYAFLKWIFS